MGLFQLASWILAALAGAIAHELAHWIVWLATGRKPKLDLWQLHVVPRAGVPFTTIGDRVAAGAPYAVGLSALLYALVASSPLVGIFGLAMVQIPSRADVETMLGRATWASLIQ